MGGIFRIFFFCIKNHSFGASGVNLAWFFLVSPANLFPVRYPNECAKTWLIKRLVPAFDVSKIPSGFQMGNRVLKAEYDRVMVPVRAALAKSLHISVYVDGWKAHNDEKVFTLVARVRMPALQ